MKTTENALAVSNLTSDEIKQEIHRIKRKQRQRGRTGFVAVILMLTFLIAVLILMLRFPLMRIHGSSMEPTYREGDVVIANKGGDFSEGDIVAFRTGEMTLVKRVIAGPGQTVDIREDGTVVVDEKVLDEDYLTEHARGTCTIDLPCHVPEGAYFVLGDHRSSSTDSRSRSIGCIYEEDIIGPVIYRIWEAG